MAKNNAEKTKAYWGPWVMGWMGRHANVPVDVVVNTHLKLNRRQSVVALMFLEYDLRSGWMAAQFNLDRAQRQEYC